MVLLQLPEDTTRQFTGSLFVVKGTAYAQRDRRPCREWGGGWHGWQILTGYYDETVFLNICRVTADEMVNIQKLFLWVFPIGTSDKKEGFW